MEYSNSNNKNIILYVIIFALVIGMGVLGFNMYSLKSDIKENTQENTSNVNKNNSTQMSDVQTNVQNETNDPKDYKIEDITGMYKVETDYSSYGINSIDLILYSNGCFKYTSTSMIPSGVLGHYNIDGNKITLTYWFITGSDVSLYYTKGTKVLTINADGTITDNNLKLKTLLNNNVSQYTLKRKNDAGEFDLSNTLAGAFADENYNQIADPVI